MDYATDTDDVLKCVINVIEGAYLGISRTVEVEVLILLFPVTISGVPSLPKTSSTAWPLVTFA